MTLILANGRFHTLNPRAPTAEAVAVEGEGIVAVGRLADVRRQSPGEELDLGGAALFPGFADAHAHLLLWGLSLSGIDCTASLEELLRRVRDAAGKPGWILGRGWDQERWGGAFPDRVQLDQAAPRRAVLLERVDGHAAWASSASLDAARIGADTPDPPGGRILRRADGEPTGILLDRAMELVTAVVPPPTAAERRDALLDAGRRFASLGVTAVHDAGCELETLGCLASLEESLPIRVHAMALATDPLLGEILRRGPRRAGRHSLACVKAFADGALGSRGALLSEPYSDDPSTSGLEVTPRPALEALAGRVRDAGFQLAVHAIGDRAVHTALQVAAAQRLVRPRIEHAQVVDRSDLALFRGSGAVASMQPVHARSDAPWAGKRLGPDRLGSAYAWRTLALAGIPLAFGSDCPVGDPNPLAGLRAALEGPEALPVEAVIAAYTRGAAFAAMDERAGCIEPGMRADLTAFDADPLAGEMPSRAVLTVVAGQVVFRQ